MNAITTPDAPPPAGHYSQAIVHGGFVFVAGQLPLDPATRKLVAPGDAAAQTEQALQNVAAILTAAGSGLSRVVSLTIYVTNVEHWPAVNGVCARLFGDHRPARAVVPAGELRHGCLIEIQAIAAAT
ncbi:MAG: RidA family protein [Gemmatimonadales bacterium]